MHKLVLGAAFGFILYFFVFVVLDKMPHQKEKRAWWFGRILIYSLILGCLHSGIGALFYFFCIWCDCKHPLTKHQPWSNLGNGFAHYFERQVYRIAPQYTEIKDIERGLSRAEEPKQNGDRGLSRGIQYESR